LQDEAKERRKAILSNIGEDLLLAANDQPFRFPATFTFVVRSFTVLDGIGKSLDPRCVRCGFRCVFTSAAPTPECTCSLYLTLYSVRRFAEVPTVVVGGWERQRHIANPRCTLHIARTTLACMVVASQRHLSLTAAGL
jgi:hypothetical protein